VAREYQRRRSNRETRTRAAHPLIGGLLLSLGGTPQHESAFHQGELGERAVAASLEQRTARGPAIVLHDRRMPRGRGNIDHLAVAPAGVFVIDAKNIHGKVRVVNPLFGGQKLLISGRDRTKLIDGLDRQVYAVRGALAASGHADVPVQGVLCFTTAELPLLGALKMRGHLLLYRRALGKRLNAGGPLDPAAIGTLARILTKALPSA
jgi:Nuclease-related domain